MRASMSQGLGMTSDRTRRRLVDRLVEQGIDNEEVLSAVESVPRHFFVEESIAHLAYEDRALPIGKRQTISQPYIVALMTQALVQAGEVCKVLEIGTGCGYQTAILAQLFDIVYSIERIESLSLSARRRMRKLGLENVRIRFGDGNQGWEEYAPYDAIIVTAAAHDVPNPLKSQLRDSGRIVIPLGRDGYQDLVALDRNGSEWQQTLLETVTFVPLLAGTIQ